MNQHEKPSGRAKAVARSSKEAAELDIGVRLRAVREKAGLSQRDLANAKPGQGAGAIHIHPNGRFVYLTNRNSRTVDFEGKKVFAGGTDGELLAILKKNFTTVKHAKPPASRKGSSEWYVIAQGFKARTEA